MKKIKNTYKTNFFKKVFIKLCRMIGFELIDQSNLYLPTLEKSANENLSNLGKNNISLSLGETKIKRIVKSLDIIIKTCTSVNLVTQNKKRVFEKNKSEYTFRTINSIINSLKKNSEELKTIKIKIFIIDYNSEENDLRMIGNLLDNSKIEYEIVNLDF